MSSPPLHCCLTKGQQSALGAQKCHFEGRAGHLGVSHGLKCWHWRESAMCESVCACEVSGSAAQILSAASVMSSRATVRWQCSGFWSSPMTWWHKTPPCHHCSGTQWAEHLPKELLGNSAAQDVTFLTQVTLLPFHISKSKKLRKPLKFPIFQPTSNCKLRAVSALLKGRAKDFPCWAESSL